jgi:excisionase family DNA binding protein
MTERLYSTQQVAQLLGTSPKTVGDWIRQGRLQAEQLPGGRVCVGESSLARFLESQGIDLEGLMAQIVLAEAKSRRPEPGRPASGNAFPSAAPEFAAPAAKPPPPAPAEAPGPRAKAPPAPAEAPAPRAKAPPARAASSPPAPAAVSAPATKAPPVRAAVSAPAAKAPPIPAAVSAPATKAPPARAASSPPAGNVDHIVDAILADAVKRRATAIHLESQSDGLALRLRIGGRLYEKPNFRQRLPQGMAARLLAAFEQRAGLAAGASGEPREGAFSTCLAGRNIELGLSTCPTVQGKSLVVRIPPTTQAARIEDLGLAPDDLAALRHVLAEPGGLVLVTAPPRTAVARTLLALASAVAAPERSTALVGDALGGPLPGAIHVRRPAGMGPSVAALVRGLRGQDADVIVIDEVLDRATAAAAVEAGAAGHLVLAAMPGRALAPDPTILTAAGVDPLAVSQALLAVIVQRTLRRICGHCKSPAPIDPDLLKRGNFDPLSASPTTWIGRGCAHCRRTGYAGEVDAFAVLTVDPEVARRISAGGDGRSINEAARRAGARTLPEAIMERVREGATSLEEAERVLGW